MTSIPQAMISRMAYCGHEYELPAGSPGRRRKFCPDCVPEVQEVRQEGECRQCGARVVKGRNGPLPDYCTTKCRRAADYERRKDRIAAARRAENKLRRAEAVKTCPQCKVNFTPEKTLAQKFCSKRCSRNFHRDNSGKLCSFDDCDRPLNARGMCVMHWRRWARATGREKAPEWNERRRAHYQKRRALKQAVPSAYIVSGEIFERDGWRCGLCGEGIDPAAAYPDPLSASLDHVVPLSLGGHHVPGNVQAAHLSCNVRKGNRVSVDAMSA